jgi:hypothetical protein
MVTAPLESVVLLKGFSPSEAMPCGTNAQKTSKMMPMTIKAVPLGSDSCRVAAGAAVG